MIRRNPCRALWSAAVLAVLALTGASAQLAGEGEKAAAAALAPGSFAVELGRTTAPLPLEKIIQAALVFSDVPAEKIPGYGSQIDGLIEEAALETADADDPAALADRLLGLLHERVLVHYEEPQTRMDVLLDQGRFNCVSSAILYFVLARSQGLDVGGLKTRDHALCIVRADGEAYDVETTNVYGFNPGEKKEFLDAFGNTGYSYVPPGNYRHRTETDEKGLLALILQNRSSVAGEQGRHADAVGPAVDAFFVLRDEDSFGKMVSSLLNLSASYAMDARYADALAFLDGAMAGLRGAYERSFGGSVGDAAAGDAAAGDAATSGYTAESFQAKLEGDDRLVRQRSNILENWIVSLFQSKEWSRAEALIEEQHTRGSLSDGKRQEFLVYIYQVKAHEISRGGRFLDAMQSIQQAIAVLGADEKLLQSLSVYRKNYEAKVHNSMVAAYREGRYEEAARIVEAGLERLPDSAALKKDLELLEEAVASGE